MIRRRSVKRQHGADTGNANTPVDTTRTKADFNVVDAGLCIGLNELEVSTIVSALVCGISMAAMAAFTYEDVTAADRRLLQYKAVEIDFVFNTSCYLHEQYDIIEKENFTADILHNRLVYCGPDFLWLYKFYGKNYPVSGGFAFCGSLATSMTLLSLIGLAICRVVASFLEDVQHSDKATSLLLFWLNPSIYASLFLVALGSLIVIPQMFFLGWIVFPTHIASSWSWVMTGGVPMIFLLIATCICIYVKVKLNAVLKEDDHLQGGAEDGNGLGGEHEHNPNNTVTLNAIWTDNNNVI